MAAPTLTINLFMAGGTEAHARSRPGEDLNHDAAMCTAIAKTSPGITYFVFPFAGPTGGGQIAALPFYSLRLPLFNSSHACETRLCSSPTISSIRCFNSGFIRKAKKIFLSHGKYKSAFPPTQSREQFDIFMTHYVLLPVKIQFIDLR